MTLAVRDGNNAAAAMASNLVSGEHVVVHSDANVGAIADAAASSDFGGFSLIALFKRLLLIKLPDAVAGKIPVDSTVATYGTPTLTVTSALSAGISFNVAKFERIRIQINNTGSAALTGLEISTKAHASGDWQVNVSTGANYTTPANSSFLKHSRDLSGNLLDCTTLPAGGKGILSLDLTTFFCHEIRIRATSGTSTTLDFLWGGA